MADDKKATGVGAAVGGVAGGVAGGAAAGAAVGGMTGPVGAVVGAAAGAVVGALTGKSIAADPKAEDQYWRDNYGERPYTSGGSFDDFGPAYGYGVSSYNKYRDQGRSFDDYDAELERDWNQSRGASKLDWERARPASRDAWERLSDRVERAVPGDSDKDGL